MIAISNWLWHLLFANGNTPYSESAHGDARQSMPRLTYRPGLCTDGPGLSTPFRYVDGNNVRFRNGRAETIDLWRPLTTAVHPLEEIDSEAIFLDGNARGIAGNYNDNRAPFALIGTHKRLYRVSHFSVTAGWTITPVAEWDGSSGSATGSINDDTLAMGFAGQWSMQPVGDSIFAMPNWTNRLVLAKRGSATITSAVPQCHAAFVTEDNFAVYVGIFSGAATNADPYVSAAWTDRTVVWSDQDAYDDFTISDLTLSRFYDLNDAGFGIGGGATTLGNFVWSDNAIYAMRPLYDTELVFGFDKLANRCGLIAPRAWAEADGRLWWMSPKRAIHVYDGGSVREVPCEVRGQLTSINPRRLSLVHTSTDISNQQVIWWLPGNGQSEISGFVSLNYETGEWSKGDLPRTCALDRGVFPIALAVGADGIVYEHGMAPGDAGVMPRAWSLAMAPLDASMVLPQADYEDTFLINRLSIDRVTQAPPDHNAAFDVTLRRRDWPEHDGQIARSETKRVHPETDTLTFNIEGRQIEIAFSGESAATHRFGDIFPWARQAGGR